MRNQDPFRRFFASFVLAAFVSTSVAPPSYAQAVLLPEPGTQIGLTAAFVPPHLIGVTIDPANALKFDFLIHKGEVPLTDDQKREEYRELIKYFLAALTVPNHEQWVNLSPYEGSRIVTDNFGLTEMGRDLLAQDYLLKQLTASLMHPDSELGKKFWEGIYEKVYAKYGTTDIPVDTFNKIWIVPDNVSVYEKDNTALIVDRHLKIMTERDYLSMEKNVVVRESGAPKADETTQLSSEIVKEIIVPAIEREVNEGRTFANLRQIYDGMILATWFKQSLKESILGKAYADRVKLKGVDQDPKNNQQIYDQYLAAFKKGVFNMIREDVDRYTQEMIPRKYFSGGANPVTKVAQADAAEAARVNQTAIAAGNVDRASTALVTQAVPDAAMANERVREQQNAAYERYLEEQRQGDPRNAAVPMTKDQFIRAMSSDGKGDLDDAAMTAEDIQRINIETYDIKPAIPLHIPGEVRTNFDVQNWILGRLNYLISTGQLNPDSFNDMYYYQQLFGDSMVLVKGLGPSSHRLPGLLDGLNFEQQKDISNGIMSMIKEKVREINARGSVPGMRTKDVLLAALEDAGPKIYRKALTAEAQANEIRDMMKRGDLNGLFWGTEQGVFEVWVNMGDRLGQFFIAADEVLKEIRDGRIRVVKNATGTVREFYSEKPYAYAASLEQLLSEMYQKQGLSYENMKRVASALMSKNGNYTTEAEFKSALATAINELPPELQKEKDYYMQNIDQIMFYQEGKRFWIETRNDDELVPTRDNEREMQDYNKFHLRAFQRALVVFQSRHRTSDDLLTSFERASGRIFRDGSPSGSSPINLESEFRSRARDALIDYLVSRYSSYPEQQPQDEIHLEDGIRHLLRYVSISLESVEPGDSYVKYRIRYSFDLKKKDAAMRSFNAKELFDQELNVQTPDEIVAKEGEYDSLARSYADIAAAELFEALKAIEGYQEGWSEDTILRAFRRIAERVVGHMKEAAATDPSLIEPALKEHISYVAGELSRKYNVDEKDVVSALEAYFQNNGDIEKLRAFSFVDDGFLKDNGWMLFGELKDAQWSYEGFASMTAALNTPGVYAFRAAHDFAIPLSADLQGVSVNSFFESFIMASPEQKGEWLDGKGTDSRMAAMAQFAARAAQLGWVVSQIGKGIAQAKKEIEQINKAKAESREGPKIKSVGLWYKPSLMTTFDKMKANRGLPEVVKDFDQIMGGWRHYLASPIILDDIEKTALQVYGLISRNQGTQGFRNAPIISIDVPGLNYGWGRSDVANKKILERVQQEVIAEFRAQFSRMGMTAQGVNRLMDRLFVTDSFVDTDNDIIRFWVVVRDAAMTDEEALKLIEQLHALTVNRNSDRSVRIAAAYDLISPLSREALTEVRRVNSQYGYAQDADFDIARMLDDAAMTGMGTRLALFGIAAGLLVGGYGIRQYSNRTIPQEFQGAFPMMRQVTEQVTFEPERPSAVIYRSMTTEYSVQEKSKQGVIAFFDALAQDKVPGAGPIATALDEQAGVGDEEFAQNLTQLIGKNGKVVLKGGVYTVSYTPSADKAMTADEFIGLLKERPADEYIRGRLTYVTSQGANKTVELGDIVLEGDQIVGKDVLGIDKNQKMSIPANTAVSFSFYTSGSEWLRIGDLRSRGAGVDYAEKAGDPLGGIDFNEQYLKMNIKRDGNGVPLPVAQQDLDNIRIDGLVPQILTIQPVMSLPILSDAGGAAPSSA